MTYGSFNMSNYIRELSEKRQRGESRRSYIDYLLGIHPDIRECGIVRLLLRDAQYPLKHLCRCGFIAVTYRIFFVATVALQLLRLLVFNPQSPLVFLCEELAGPNVPDPSTPPLQVPQHAVILPSTIDHSSLRDLTLAVDDHFYTGSSLIHTYADSRSATKLA